MSSWRREQGSFLKMAEAAFFVSGGKEKERIIDQDFSILIPCFFSAG